MAVLPAQTVEVKAPREATETRERFEIFRAWHVFTDSAADTEITALAAPGIPYLYSPHPSHAGCLVIRRRAKRADVGRMKWMVECDYSTDYGDKTKAVENPLDEPYQITGNTADRIAPLEETVEEDKGDAAPVVNSAGDTFSTPITTEKHRVQFTITKNYATDGLADVTPFVNAVNKVDFLGLPALCVKLSSFSFTLKTKSGFGFYWERRYVFDFAPSEEDPDYDAEANQSPWDARILDKGFRTLLLGEYAPILDRSGQPREALLDGTGAELEAAAGARPVYLRFRRHKRRDFNELGI